MTEKKQEKNNKAFEERSDKESAKEFYTEVNNAIQSIEDTSTSMSQLLKQHKSALDTFEQGVEPLYLLPQKTKNAVDNLAPKIAEEVEGIHSARMDAIVHKIDSFNQNMKSNCEKFEKSLENAAITSIEQIKASHLELVADHKQQIAEYQQTLTKGAKEITDNNGGKFLRNLVITVIIATFAAGFTSWGIHYYFPKPVNILKSGDIAIQNSKIKLFAPRIIKTDGSNTVSKMTE